MNLGSLEEARAAEIFATTLHDTWGVGYSTPAGGTGILIFLSINDRVMYISRGGAIAPILTDSRTDRIIETVKPALREAQYGPALEQVIALLSNYLEQGRPQGWEYWRDEVLLPYGTPFGMALVFGTVAWIAMKRERDQQRAYAAVSSQLSQLDRAQAQALQGQYQATSCPICLEDFVTIETMICQPVTSLSPSNETQEEVLDVMGSGTGSETTTTPCSTRTQMEKRLVGADGQPLKLLRCGHVFDESCWAEWVSSGTGVSHSRNLRNKSFVSENSHWVVGLLLLLFAFKHRM